MKRIDYFIKIEHCQVTDFSNTSWNAGNYAKEALVMQESKNLRLIFSKSQILFSLLFSCSRTNVSLSHAASILLGRL